MPSFFHGFDDYGQMLCYQKGLSRRLARNLITSFCPCIRGARVFLYTRVARHHRLSLPDKPDSWPKFGQPSSIVHQHLFNLVIESWPRQRTFVGDLRLTFGVSSIESLDEFATGRINTFRAQLARFEIFSHGFRKFNSIQKISRFRIIENLQSES